MHWATQFIGIPWKFGGRDIEEGVDCYGLFQYIQKHHYGITTSEIEITSYNFKRIVKEFETNKELSSWTEVKTPKDGDAVLLRMAKYPNHVGVWIDEGDTKGVLHSIEKTGAMFSTRKSLQVSGWKIARYYRHNTKL